MAHQPARLTLVVGHDQYLSCATRMQPEEALTLAASLVAAAEAAASKDTPFDATTKVVRALVEAEIMTPLEAYTL